MTEPTHNPWLGPHDRRRPHPMPRARVTLMIAIIAGLLVGSACIIWLIAELRLLMDRSRIPTREDLDRAALAFKIVSMVMSLSLIGVAIWIGHFAWRIQKHAVYPPPGSRHLRVRRVLRDNEARRVAFVCYLAAGLLAMLGATIAPVAFHVVGAMRY